jgi:hypothetical protein
MDDVFEKGNHCGDPNGSVRYISLEVSHPGLSPSKLSIKA